MGRADYLEPGDWNAMCSRCGHKFKASQLRRHWQGMMRCPRCWEPRQPQDFVKAIPDVQTPPWTQPWPADRFTTESYNYTTSASSQTITVTIASSIIVTIYDGVSINGLTISAPAGSDITINVIGGSVSGISLTGGVTSGDLSVRTLSGGAYLPYTTSFSVQPLDTTPAVAISPAVEVSLLDSTGATITSYTGNVTVSLASGTATLGGTLTKAAVAGVATFNDLTLDRVGEGFTLSAVASTQYELVISAASEAFSCTGALIFTVQPSDTSINTTISPSVVVAATNSLGAAIASYTGNVTISLASGTGAVTGTLTKAAVSGVATFDDLQVTAAGDHTLQAAPSNSSITSAISASFSVTAFHLIIAADTNTYHVDDEFDAAFGPPPDSVHLLVTVNPGVVVMSTNAPSFGASMKWGTNWGAGTNVFSLVNQGYIIGRGGGGGAGADAGGGVPGADGGFAGAALDLNGNTVNITNASGFIWGGGGGGGGGGEAGGDSGPSSGNAGGGGGGAGAGNALGAGGGSDISGVDVTVDTTSTAGASTSGAAPGQVGAINGVGSTLHLTASPTTQSVGGAGGTGGNYGEPGASGGVGSTTFPSNVVITAGGAGGDAGNAITLSGGTVVWVSGSSAPNVKGVVA